MKKRKRQIKSGNISDLVQQLKEETEPFAEHLFNKDWQNHQEKVLKEKDNLKIGDLVLVVDELKHGNQWPLGRVGYVS